MLKNIYCGSKNDVPEMYFDSIPSIDGTWLIIIKGGPFRDVSCYNSTGNELNNI